MPFLQLTMHCKELEIQGIACNCSLFNSSFITSCGLWGQEIPEQHQSDLSPFPGHTALPWLPLPRAPCRSCASGRAFPHTLLLAAGFQREPGDHRPCVGSPRGLPGWPRGLCQGAAGKRCPGKSWGCHWGRGHLGTDALRISGDVGRAVRVSGPRCRWTSQTEMWKNVTMFCFPGW